MFADFRDYYGLRLTDIYKFDGSLPIWEAAILADQLPPESRTARALGDGWTNEQHMLASIFDAIQVNTFAFVSAHSKRKLKAPKPIPRPGDEERKRREKENNPFAVMVKKQMAELQKGG